MHVRRSCSPSVCVCLFLAHINTKPPTVTISHTLCVWDARDRCSYSFRVSRERRSRMESERDRSRRVGIPERECVAFVPSFVDAMNSKFAGELCAREFAAHGIIICRACCCSNSGVFFLFCASYLHKRTLRMNVIIRLLNFDVFAAR